MRALGIAVIVSVLVAGSSAHASRAPHVFSARSHAYGKTYGEWAATWWQWALGIPVSNSPLFDDTGEHCDVDQSGPVWFLVGTTGSGDTSAERHCTVPAGKGLFIPIANIIWITTPGDPGIDEIRQIVHDAADGISGVACEIDGHSVEPVREVSTVFDLNLPADNEFGVDAGVYSPCVDEGYYVLTAPLRVGEHTVHFHSVIPAFEFSLDVTYHLTVAPSE